MHIQFPKYLIKTVVMKTKTVFSFHLDMINCHVCLGKIVDFSFKPALIYP